MAHVMGLAPCTGTDCDLTTRPPKWKISQAPGTLQRFGSGLCKRCWLESRREAELARDVTLQWWLADRKKRMQSVQHFSSTFN